jgi:hypothetical protein
MGGKLRTGATRMEVIFGFGGVVLGFIPLNGKPALRHVGIYAITTRQIGVHMRCI